ncbi:hypothetical protein F5B17DRAFT_91569 [Nemania serpens]|nr:hypothetical protein F5B17DRAFT_91569 [Nemania serpens]
MKTSIILAAISAGLTTASLLAPPDNFPDCGTTCFNGVLGQAAELGCGGGGTTANAVDGACLCKNINFSYGIIDCANAACPPGVAKTVIQYGINWCAEKGVIVDGLSASADPAIASSPTATVIATATTKETSSGSGTASVTASEIILTVTNSDGSPVPTTIGTTFISNSSTSATDGVLVPISTTEVVSTLTNSDGTVVTTTLATSTIFSTSFAPSGSGTESVTATGSGSVSGSTITGESTITTGGSTEVTGVTTTLVSSTDDTATPTSTSTDSGSGSRQTAAPVGIIAAAGLAALML